MIRKHTVKIQSLVVPIYFDFFRKNTVFKSTISGHLAQKRKSRDEDIQFRPESFLNVADVHSWFILPVKRSFRIEVPRSTHQLYHFIYPHHLSVFELFDQPKKMKRIKIVFFDRSDGGEDDQKKRWPLRDSSKPRDCGVCTLNTSGRRSHLQGRCKPSASVAPGVTPMHEDSRRSSWIVCGKTWIRHPALAIGGANCTLTLSLTSSTRPQLEETVLNGLFPWNTPLFPRMLSY
jgi:hypothetical protein